MCKGKLSSILWRHSRLILCIWKDDVLVHASKSGNSGCLLLQSRLKGLSWETLFFYALMPYPPPGNIMVLSVKGQTLAGQSVAWENSRHLATLPLVSPPNNVWETSAEIPCWWSVTTQTCILSVLLSWQVSQLPSFQGHLSQFQKLGLKRSLLTVICYFTREKCKSFALV